MTPYDSQTPPSPVPDDSLNSAASNAPFSREIELDFPVGDGRTGRCHVRLFRVLASTGLASSGAEQEAEPEVRDEGLVVALIKAPPGGGGFDLMQYTLSIAGTLCARENIVPDRLIYLDHDEDRASRLAQWAVLMGPQTMHSYGATVSEGGFDNEAFHLVAFEFRAGALASPRFTPLSRLDVEGILGRPLP